MGDGKGNLKNIIIEVWSENPVQGEACQNHSTALTQSCPASSYLQACPCDRTQDLECLGRELLGWYQAGLKLLILKAGKQTTKNGTTRPET